MTWKGVKLIKIVLMSTIKTIVKVQRCEWKIFRLIKFRGCAQGKTRFAKGVERDFTLLRSNTISKNCQILSHYGLLNNHKNGKYENYNFIHKRRTTTTRSSEDPFYTHWTSCFHKRITNNNNCLIHFSFILCFASALCCWRRRR